MALQSLSQTRATPRRALKPLSILSTSALHGCNILHTSTLLRVRVDWGGWNEDPQLDEKFAQRFSERFLNLPRLMDEPLRTINFCNRLLTNDAPPMPEILLEAIIAVENAVAARMHRLDTVEFATFSDAELAWSSQSTSVSKLCAAAAIAGVNELFGLAPSKRQTPSTAPFDDQFAALESMAISRRLTTTVSVIRETAKARGIPVAYVGGSYLRLGQGKHQTYFRGSITGKTSHAASQMSIDKRLAAKALRLQRLPVPKHVQAKSLASATEAVSDLGLPVVIKPIKGHGGAGVTVVHDPAEVPAAYKRAAKGTTGALVEQFIDGKSFRLLVINGNVAAALRIDPPEVTGDGASSVAELIAELNRDPFRDGFRLLQIELDKPLARHLRKFDATFETVLAAGKKLRLRAVANVSQGGYSVDVTKKVHPDNAEIAVQAARVIGLDVAGIDFLTPDISQSYKEVGGAIVEVNGRPGLGMHYWPRKGKQRDVGGAVVDMMYPQGTRAAIDTGVIVGDRQTAVVARDLDALLRDMGSTVGLTIKSRVFVNGERRELKGRKPTRAIRMLLREPLVDSLIATAAPANIVANGLLLNTVDVAAIVAPEKGADLEAYGQAVDVLLAAKPSRLIVNADNPMAAQIAKRLGAARVTLVNRVGLTKSLRTHLTRGGHAIVTRWIAGLRHIEIHEAGRLIASLPATGALQAEQGPAKDHKTAVNSTGARSQRIEPRMFAVALAVALGRPIDQVAKALARAPLAAR